MVTCDEARSIALNDLNQLRNAGKQYWDWSARRFVDYEPIVITSIKNWGIGWEFSYNLETGLEGATKGLSGSSPIFVGRFTGRVYRLSSCGCFLQLVTLPVSLIANLIQQLISAVVSRFRKLL